MYSNYYSKVGVNKVLRNIDTFCPKLLGVLQNITIFIFATVTASKFLLQKYFLSYYSNNSCWVLASNCKMSNSSTIYYRHLFFANSFKWSISNPRIIVTTIVYVVKEMEVDKYFKMEKATKQ